MEGNVSRDGQSSFGASSYGIEAADSIVEEDEQLHLQWAAIQKLPTFKRLKTSLVDVDLEAKGNRDKKDGGGGGGDGDGEGKKVTDVTKLTPSEKHLFIDKLIKNIEDDNLRLLRKLRDRTDRKEQASRNQSHHPKRCFWSHQTIKVSGEVSYNGYKLDEFVPQKTSAYISQSDLHIPEMTVRETIDFSAHCQGVGSRADLMTEVSRREKEEGIVPDPDVDTYMKSISAKGQKTNLQTDYILKLMLTALMAMTVFVRTEKKVIRGNTTLGVDVLTSHGLFSELQRREDDSSSAREMNESSPAAFPKGKDELRTTGMMILPFEPLTMTFKEVQYSVDTPVRFVEEVIQTIELDNIKLSIVGIPGESGLSTEQRKRLTIAVELVSNPFIIFMDEPTSGLDARAAAVVMRAVKNVAATGRTTVCTIHQPSIDVFESFDEVCQRSKTIIIQQHGCWKLHLHQDNIELVNQLSEPPQGSKELKFSGHFPRSSWEQFIACLWKQHLSYWRSPEYNLARFMFMIFSSLLFGIVFWQKGKDINNEQDLINILGQMYIAVIFLGINNCTTVLPYVATERTVLYRENFAGMYSPWAYSFAQVTIEVPYVLLQAILYVAITYPSIGYYWSALKVFWYFYTTFCTFLYFVYLGMLLVSVTPNEEVASILSIAFYTTLNLFSGFLMPGKQIPKWWIWCYYISPTSWSLNGLLTSQYGDIEKEILIFGELKTVGSFLRDYYGFRHDGLGVVAVALTAFPVAFASLFAYCTGKLNYQRSEMEGDNEEELELQWAAIERLPTLKRARTCLFDTINNHQTELSKDAAAAYQGKKVTDVTKLNPLERHLFIQKLINNIENDNLRLLLKLRDRIDRVNVKLPTVEVRYKDLSVEAECETVQGEPLPTLWNTLKRILPDFKMIGRSKPQDTKLSILKDVSGIIKPSRLTLLLGPPGCGKTTFLKALAGRLDQSLKVSGEISYNGYKLDEFVPQKTSVYISQSDLHIPQMTVRETIDFSARCQGVGSRADIMMEVIRREKEAGIVPDPDIDTYMKLVFTAFVAMTVFIRTQMGVDVFCSNAPAICSSFIINIHVSFHCFNFPNHGTCWSNWYHDLSNNVLIWWLHSSAKWGFWISPIAYGQIGISVNEFLAPRWQKFFNNDNLSSGVDETSRAAFLETNADPRETGMMALPFEPLTMAFMDVQYFVDTPPEMRKHGFNDKKLKLLCHITGAFRPGVLTALMGVSGAGKTTLMDVLCGRKTGGYIEGDIRVGGYPKVQKTFARICGYCEQNDIHSPQTTVQEAVIFSAFLRLPPEIDAPTKARFVEEVIQTIELDDIKNSLVGIQGQSGLSTEQRKRLTIAVELVSNPSIIFMDEPTSGLDARAAAIVMRAVKNLILMKRGGEIIFSGMLGHHSNNLIEYFEVCQRSKIIIILLHGCWKLLLHRYTNSLVQQLSEPPSGSPELKFSSRFPQSSWKQFVACLWKHQLSYWRSPEYNLARNNEQDLINILGSMYLAVIYMGITNCSTVIPYVVIERSVLYRENFAGMYSPWAYSLAQVTIEIPYILLQTILYVAVIYPSIGYYWSAFKKIPKWWIWFYYLCPTSWSLNGLLTSQYGDINKEIFIFGELKTVGSFLHDYYGFRHDRLSLVAAALIAFPIAFASLFAYFTGKLNYQRR
ncbi:hypothetical protein Tsubulata_026482 [Turnera subulata]|uniref:ABC transporter domain-containing protein n=1 Tax=Turnera subulata TaxID=218843 RepID=A0A9Q0J061_9ROSI|nr:hypothetical protein Tsubulata_026482 [Turnera subulata]